MSFFIRTFAYIKLKPMTKVEYDSIDNTFDLIEQKTIYFCDSNNVNFYNYLGEFKILLKNYIVNKNTIETINNLNWVDPIKVRAVLNTKDFGSKEHETKKHINLFEKSKECLFKWLDNTKDPYFFILNPIYNYGAGSDYNSYFSKRHGYKKVDFTGIQNLDIAIDYALYKLKI